METTDINIKLNNLDKIELWWRKKICSIREVYYSIRYNAPISGHNFVLQDNGTLFCTTCGYISE